MTPQALSFARGSIADVLYPAGAIVVCRNCGKPLYRLTRSIYLGENAGSKASREKYAPVTMADLQTLIERNDLDPGQRAVIKAMSLDDRRLHCDKVQPIGAGMSDACPACSESFVMARAAETDEGRARFNAREYVISLAIIPPQGGARRA